MTLALVAVAFLLTYLVHSTLLLGGAWVLTATGAVKAPHARDTLWKVCLVGGLLTATVQTTWPGQPFGRRFWLPGAAQAAQVVAAATPAPTSLPAPVPARPSVPSVARRAQAPAGSAPATVASRAPISASRAPTPYTPHPTPRRSGSPIWIPFLLGLWILAALALLARLYFRRRRFCRRLEARRELGEGPLLGMLESLRAGAGVRRRIRLCVSPELSGPVAMGSSEICLPERVLTSLSPSEQRAVLAHELGHLVRRDPEWLAIAVVLESVFCFQPLNRLARRRGQEAAELICDDWAVHQTGGSLTLAKCLAEVATWVQRGYRPVPVSGMAENRSQLVQRVQRLLDGAEPRAVRGFRLAVPVAALALSAVAFAAPGVVPPRADAPARVPVAQAAQAPAPVVAVRSAARQGEPHTWATVRDGRMITFRSGFAPRISGQGRIGMRERGRAIALVGDQRFEVNGRVAEEGDDVAVRDTDTLRITDGDGRVEWTLEPVRLSPAQAEAWDRAEPSLESDSDLAVAELDDSVSLLAADLAPELARIGPRVAAQLQVDIDRIRPEIARLQDRSVREGLRIAAAVAPRLAAMSAKISAQVAEEIGPAIARAFGDSCACDSLPSRRAARPKHR